MYSVFFFFNDTATTEIYTLSLHDALPILGGLPRPAGPPGPCREDAVRLDRGLPQPAQRPRSDGARRSGSGDRKSTRLNSSHANISYAVFCLKKKNNKSYIYTIHAMQLSPI